MIITQKEYNSAELQELYENHPRWIVTLKKGEEEFFSRPTGHPSDCWRELGRYLSENPEYQIIGMMVGFRDNLVALPLFADGYFFRCSILATHGWEKHSFIIGVLKNGILELDKYELPEMIYCGHEQRDKSTAEWSLICPMKTSDQMST